ncbi:hypothetical protein [Actinokineospora iranica]|uniref:hypothetical protein n=1 Tax=Actinokineospora iranica TaxID=1271860 RepID=UPI00111437A0|nr:hypothetical protein [Actinokineospora iranica]
MTDPIAARDAELAGVFERLEQAAEQEAAWRDEKESLVRQAKALGASHRAIGGRIEMSHTGVGKLITRTTPAADGSGDVG